MKYIWEKIENLHCNKESKYDLCIWIFNILAAAAGAFFWWLLKEQQMADLSVLPLFVMFPVIISWFALFFYSCSHEFHNVNNR